MMALPAVNGSISHSPCRRLPTSHLSVDLILPAGLDPAVWGTETSTTAEAVPLHTPPTRRDNGTDAVFSWATDDPPMSARYRLEWRFRARPGDGREAYPELRTASDRMKRPGSSRPVTRFS